MKKILILLITFFILTSCNNKENNKVETSEVKKTEVVTEIIPEVINEKDLDIVVENVEENLDKWITFSEIRSNLSKLEGLNLENRQLEEINIQLKSIYSNYIYNQVKKTENTTLCEKLNSYESDICKTNFIVSNSLESWNTEKCEILSGSWVINNCKNSIHNENAKKNLSVVECEKISNDMEKNMCIEMIKMEKEMAERELKEAKIRKREEIKMRKREEIQMRQIEEIKMRQIEEIKK
jgi:hypothetical protein